MKKDNHEASQLPSVLAFTFSPHHQCRQGPPKPAEPPVASREQQQGKGHSITKVLFMFFRKAFASGMIG